MTPAPHRPLPARPVFSDIIPGEFVLVSGEPALVTSKDRGGRGPGGGLVPSCIRIKTADFDAICSYAEVTPFSLLEPVTTDREFLGTLHALAELLGLQARIITEWAGALNGMSLPASVTEPLYDASDRLAAARAAAAQARRDFKDHFENARAAAARGLRITGQDTA